MGVNTTGLLNTQTEVYASYKNDAVTKNETAAKKDSTAKTEEKNESGVVYDKSDSSKDNKKATYSINKMSAEDRAALVQQMKADTQSRQQQLISIVQKMMTGQAATSSVANGTNSDDIWKFLAKGDFTVDAMQQLLSGQVEIVIDDETQKEIDRLFNPEKWKMKSTPFPKKNMKFETELPRYYISQVDTIDGRGYIRLLPYGPFETPEEEQIYVEIPINKELLAGYDSRLEPAPAGKFTPSALMVGAGISATFDADKLLGIIFSKKMRAKARNAKEADAWKRY